MGRFQSTSGASEATGILALDTLALFHQRAAGCETVSCLGQVVADAGMRHLGIGAVALLQQRDEGWQPLGRPATVRLEPGTLSDARALSAAEVRAMAELLRGAAGGWLVPIGTIPGTSAVLAAALERPASAPIRRFLAGLAAAAGTHLQRLTAGRLTEEHEAWLQAVIHHMAEGVVTLDAAGRVIDANVSAARILGRSLGEMLAPKAEREPVLRSDGTDYAPAELAPALTLACGKPVYHQLQGRRRPDGGTVWLSLNTAPLYRRGEPRPYACIASFHDITDLVEVERALRRSEERYRALVETAPEAIVVFDSSSGGFVDANHNAEVLFGVPRERLLGRSPVALSPQYQPDGTASAEMAATRLQEAVAGGCPVFEWTHVAADGRYIDCEVRLAALPGDPPQVRGSVTDISDRKRAQAALAESEQRFRALYHDNPSIFITLNDQGRIRSANRFGAELLGYGDPAQVVGQSVNQLFLPEERRSAADHVAACFDKPTLVHRWETRVAREDGGALWVRVTARVVPHPERGRELLLVCQDITEARNLSAELIYQSTHDSLTGLLNRPEFERLLLHALDDAQSNGSEHALCYLDLDQFKVVNDTFGHVAGDELLRQLSRELTGQVSKRDVLARMGGDEFGVLLEHCSARDALRIAERLRAVVEAFPFAWEGRSCRVGASIGVVPVTAARSSLTDLLSLADTACYAAKDEGRNRIHVYHEGDVEMARRHGDMQWVARLRQALDEDRLCLYYQPIVPLAAGEADDGGAHYELLVRLVDEAGEIVPPGAFLPAAEQYNMATTLDEWVVRRAFDWLAADPARIDGLALCSINLSGHSLRSNVFLDFLLGSLRGRRIPAERICFEITETAAIGNLVQATRFIETLRALGCRFALDDFGSGLSSFGYLKNLPVDYLKIDGVFVKDIADDPIDLSVVRAINEIGQVMGKRTIAEFVESEAIMARLAEIGVDYAQGYAVGRPQPLTP